MDPFSSMHTAIFDGLGHEATYTPSGGTAVSTRAIPEHNLQRWGDSIEVTNTSAVMSLPTLDVPARPKRGDTIEVDAQSWVIERVLTSDEYAHQALVVKA